jgi:hypothetical protein
MSVVLGSTVVNSMERSQAQKAKNAFIRIIKESLEKLEQTKQALSGLKGSDSFIIKTRKKTLKTIVIPFKKIKNVKITTEDTKLNLSKTSVKARKKVKTKLQTLNKQKMLPRAKKGVSSMPLYLIGVMNQQLPRVVQKNMKAPALENRTGRFASSVKVTDIISTAQGFPSIGYTYQKGPYQTFEPGYRQGSVERDPRRLIDKSIREIAIQYAIGRFYTRRE